MSDISFVTKKGKLTKYNGKGGEITIPSDIKIVGKEVFMNNNTVTAVTFSEGVEEIEDSAFEGCESLKRVYIPKSLTRFNSAAFMNAGVEEVYITDLVSWCDSYFSYATANPLGCGADLYLNGELVRDLVIPEGIESICSSAFLRCKSIKSVTFPDSVEKVWDSFEGCKNLETIRYGNGLTFEAGAYKYCDNIKEVYIDSIESWCQILFNGWVDETPLHSGATLYIGGQPTVDLVIPDSIKKIGNNAFYGCKTLKSVSFPDGIDIGYDAFAECEKLQIIEFRGNGNFDTDAFKACSSLIAVKLPSKYRVTLWNVLVEYTDAKYVGSEDRLKEQDGFRYAELRDGTYLYRWDNREENLVLPSDLNGKPYIIADFTFTDCDFIKSITIPEGAVTKISCAAFSGCDGLTEVTIPAGIELENSVFSKCKNLKKVTLNSPVGTFMFEDCQNLGEVIIADGVTYIDQYAFRGCHLLSEITVPATVECIGNGAFENCTALGKVIFVNPMDWRRTTSYVSYDYARRGGEPFNVDSPEENARIILKDGNDWFYFKPVKD